MTRAKCRQSQKAYIDDRNVIEICQLYYGPRATHTLRSSANICAAALVVDQTGENCDDANMVWYVAYRRTALRHSGCRMMNVGADRYYKQHFIMWCETGMTQTVRVIFAEKIGMLWACYSIEPEVCGYILLRSHDWQTVERNPYFILSNNIAHKIYLNKSYGFVSQYLRRSQ